MNLKLISFLMLIPFFVFGTDYSKKFGFEFMAGGTSHIGIKYHINEVYTINPGFTFQLYNFYDDETAFLVGGSFDQQFFLPAINSVDHFIFVDAGFLFWGNANALIGGGYGLQYSFNDNIAIFGKLGLSVQFPYDLVLSLGKSGVGVVIYIK